jgi:uncharacterized Fe-S center protein
MEKARIYFTEEVTSENLIRLYDEIGKTLPGKVAVKLHSGEKGNQNYLRPEFLRPIIDLVKGTVVECNTAYQGARDTTDKHLKLLEEHGWNKYFDVDLMDAQGPDLVLDIPNGQRIHKNYLGKNIQNYDSMLVLSHFKGHPMGGFGGALKQLSIGCASSHGKAFIHGAGDAALGFGGDHNGFLESMADAASSVVKLFGDKIVYLNIMCNLSVDCDCCDVAEDPCMKDIGILAGTDPVAIDQACMDLIYASKDPGRDHFLQRVESRNGMYTIEVAEKLGIGTRSYDLVKLS